MERLDIGQLFADAGKLDGLACDGTNRERGAAACVAIELGEDHACERDGLMEAFCDVDRVLTGHGVHDEQDFRGVDRVV